MIPYLNFVAHVTRAIDDCMADVLKSGSSGSLYDDLGQKGMNSYLPKLHPGRVFSVDDFGASMDAFARSFVPAALHAFDISQFKEVVDIGGGFGRLAKEFKKVYPDAAFTVFDLPEVVALAKQHYETDESFRSVQLVAGDFFQDDLPSADLFILSHVLQNWRDSKVKELLTKLNRSLIPGGAVLVLEKGLSEDKTEPQSAVLIDFACSMMGMDGAYRTEAEYYSLLRESGFTDVQFRRFHGYNDADAFIAFKK